MQVDEKQLSYRSIYALCFVKLQILKVFIKTYLKTPFIKPLKSLAGTIIQFDKKPNTSLSLCVNY